MTRPTLPVLLFLIKYRPVFNVKVQSSRIYVYLVLGLLLVGFWLRLSRFLSGIYGVDEFFSLLAAQMVAERGVPILPSGLFYDNGLLLSYLSGGLLALLGYSEAIGRWPVLLLSVLTIAAYYVAAKRLFDSATTGLLAATLVTFDVLSVEWGAQARMYTLAHLFVMLSLVWLLAGTLKRPDQRARLIFLLCLLAALFSHTVIFLILMPLAGVLLIFTLAYRRDWLYHPRLWLEIILALLLVGVVFALVSEGQVDSTVSLSGPEADAPPPFGLEFLRGFFFPGAEWRRFDDLFGFFLRPQYKWLFLLTTLSLLVSLYRLARRQATVYDIIMLFLALYWLLVILEMGGLLAHEWRKKTRYMFILTAPAFMLMSAASLSRFLEGGLRLLSPVSRSEARRPRPVPWAALAGCGLIGVMLGPAAWQVALEKGSGGYNTAFTFVAENWQAGDKIITFHPAAAYLYVGQSDYYANQETAKVLAVDDSEAGEMLIDRYVGSPLIDSVEAFNAALAENQRVWYVMDQGRFYNRFEPFFSQQVFAQMDLVRQSGLIYIFRSRPRPTPLPAEPSAPLTGNFNHIIALEGYNLNPTPVAPGGTVSLGLYWRPLTETPPLLKVFVQLRNGQGQTVAQADHFIYEGLLTPGEWRFLAEQGEWLRDSADLRLPASLPPEAGPYRLYIGLYDPATLERAPLLNDASGENAVIIDLPFPDLKSGPASG